MSKENFKIKLFFFPKRTSIPSDGTEQNQSCLYVLFCLAYCIKIRDPPNGRKFGTGSSHGRMVSFECKIGFELVGNRALRCIHGRWNSSVPVCKGK